MQKRQSFLHLPLTAPCKCQRECVLFIGTPSVTLTLSSLINGAPNEPYTKKEPYEKNAKTSGPFCNL